MYYEMVHLLQIMDLIYFKIFPRQQIYQHFGNTTNMRVLQNCAMLNQKPEQCQNVSIPNTETTNIEQNVETPNQLDKNESIKKVVKTLAKYFMKSNDEQSPQPKANTSENKEQQEIDKCFQFVLGLNENELNTFLEDLYMEMLQHTRSLFKNDHLKLVRNMVKLGNKLIKMIKPLKQLHTIVFFSNQDLFFDYAQSMFASISVITKSFVIRSTKMNKLDKEGKVWEKNKQKYCELFLNPVKEAFSSHFIKEYVPLCKKFRQMNNQEKHNYTYQILIEFFELPVFEFFTKNQSVILKYKKLDKNQTEAKKVIDSTSNTDEKKDDKNNKNKKKKERNRHKKSSKNLKQVETSITSADEESSKQQKIQGLQDGNFAIMFANFKSNQQSRLSCYLDDGWLEKTFKSMQQA